MNDTPTRRAHGVRRQLPRFVLVGCAAAALHDLIVVALAESHAAWPPRVANVAGWCGAFWLSFTGHRRLSFAAQRAGLGRALGRFFVVSGAGFLVNETVYALLLHTAGWRYDFALACVLIAVAVLTFVASRHWAFASGASEAGASQ